MNRSYMQVRAFSAACILICLFLSACESLSPTHSGSHAASYPTQTSSAQITQGATPEGYVTVWRSGELTGTCSTGNGRPGYPVIVDSIFLDQAGILTPDAKTLSQAGILKLDQALHRIHQYLDVERVEIYQAVSAEPVEMSQGDSDKKPVSLLSHYLRSHLDESLPLLVMRTSRQAEIASHLPQESDLPGSRVIIKVLATAVSGAPSSLTLCTPRTQALPAYQRAGFTDLQSQPPLVQNSVFNSPMTLSMGDRVRIRVPEDAAIDGIYEIDATGNIDLPFVGPIRALGLTVEQLEKSASKKLIHGEIIREHFAKVDVAVLQFSVADVFVSGAVFNPGRKTINGLDIELKAFKQTQNSGDAARERYLSNALVSAGGVRPDANLANITVQRQGELLNVNLEGILSGKATSDLSLVSGDEVYVPSTGSFRKELARVSQITPQGIRVYVSNLITPRIPSQVDSDATKLPYGTRLLHALLSANCVGGTQLTNSGKKALLITVNPVSQVAESVERDIQQLVNNPESELINPYLMPNDGVACYDSNVTNYRDLARTFTDLITPFTLLKVLTGS